MKLFVFVLTVFLAAPAAFAQKKPERPKVHAEFYPGTFPTSREAAGMLEKDEVRLVLVGLHQGWDLDKIAKELKLDIDDLARIFADLEEQRLAFVVDEYESRPAFPLIREKELEKVASSLATHVSGFEKVLQANWADIETMATSLSGTGSEGPAKGEVMYALVVGGLLFGSLPDAFFDDQTLTLPPPRRAGSERYYAWLIEGDAARAGKLKRESWQSDGYTVVSVGPSLPTEKKSLTDIREARGLILENPEARQLRTFLSIFARDNLLPYFKKERTDMLAAVKQFEAGKYVRVADMFSWYYDQIANGVVDSLIMSHRLQAPAEQYTYAVRTPLR